MNPINYYLKVWQNYATFSGRTRRIEFCYFIIFNSTVSFLLEKIAMITGLMILPNLYFLAVLVPAIAVAVRRMHDVGKSGWFVIIPIYNFILAFSKGDEGDNSYGPDPKTEFY